MKVVLFCGGLGMHMREASPKPMVPIGYGPILWHVLNLYYAHFCAQGFHFVPEAPRGDTFTCLQTSVTRFSWKYAWIELVRLACDEERSTLL